MKEKLTRKHTISCQEVSWRLFYDFISFSFRFSSASTSHHQQNASQHWWKTWSPGWTHQQRFKPIQCTTPPLPTTNSSTFTHSSMEMGEQPACSWTGYSCKKVSRRWSLENRTDIGITKLCKRRTKAMYARFWGSSQNVQKRRWTCTCGLPGESEFIWLTFFWNSRVVVTRDDFSEKFGAHLFVNVSVEYLLNVIRNLKQFGGGRKHLTRRSGARIDNVYAVTYILSVLRVSFQRGCRKSHSSTAQG